MKPASLIVLLAAMIFLPAWASAQTESAGGPEFLLGIGYANISVGGSSSVLNSQNAVMLDPALSISPFGSLPQLRLGVAADVGFVLDSSQRSIIFDNGGLVITGNSDVPFVLFTPEARLSWFQTLGKSQEFFIEPGIGVGGAFGWLTVNPEFQGGKSVNESESTIEGRAFLNIGMQVPDGMAGLQFSYMRGGDMDFANNARGELSAFYVGIFGAIRF
jgi:hypothetical protein